MWAFSAPDIPPWMQGRTETILRHLASCPYVTEEICRNAQQEKEAKGLNKSPSRPIHVFQTVPSSSVPPQPAFGNPTVYSSNTMSGPSSGSYAGPVLGSALPAHLYGHALTPSLAHHYPPPFHIAIPPL